MSELSDEKVSNDEDFQKINEDLEAIKARIKENDEELSKIQLIESEVEQQLHITTRKNENPAALTVAEKQIIDSRSIYVGNVDYYATAEELDAYFKTCGSINRITILCNKITGHSKGYAYIEFTSTESVENAIMFNNTFFRGRQLKIMAKRTNQPGMSTTNRFYQGFSNRRRPFGKNNNCKRFCTYFSPY